MSDEKLKEVADLRSTLEVTESTRDRLPPLTTYRSGLLASLELWIKRQLKRGTHWYTYEQVNFNSAVHASLRDILNVLSRYEQQIASIESRMAQLEARLNELSTAQQDRIGQLTDEQRVCFKQLSLQVNELSVEAERTKRSLQLRLDELETLKETLPK
jgi:predicted transcriptional regulator